LLEKAEFLAKLKAVSLEKRQEILTEHIRGQVAQVIGLKNYHIDKQKLLNKIGMDSLMSIELRNRIQSDLEVDVPITKFMEAITIAALSTEINQQLNQSYHTDNIKDNSWIEVEL